MAKSRAVRKQSVAQPDLRSRMSAEAVTDLQEWMEDYRSLFGGGSQLETRCKTHYNSLLKATSDLADIYRGDLE
jgi:hypothetical protein